MNVDGIDVAVAVTAMGAAMEMFESGEKLASACGALGPIFGVAGVLLKLMMGKGKSEELKYMKEQLGIIRNKLDIISSQVAEVLMAIDQSTAESQYFPIEENLKNQFRKYMEITMVKPECRDKEKENFLSHFLSTSGEQNLHSLYEGVLGKNFIFKVPILETAMKYHQRDRRIMEQLCARLKQLFCIGLIALMGQTALTGNDLALCSKTWEKNMSEVEEKMKTMVEKCISEFPDQAKIELEEMLKSKDTGNHKTLARDICAKLEEKYDWVYWSVRVYDEQQGFSNHCIIGPNFLRFFSLHGVNCVVSYANKNIKADPEKIVRLASLCQKSGDAKQLADHISDNMAGHVIHVVRKNSGLSHHHNFPQHAIQVSGNSQHDAIMHAL